MAKENTRELGNAGFISQFALREIIIYAHQISSCRFTASRGAFRAEEIRGVLPSRSYKPRRTKRQYWAAAKRNERVWGARSRGTLLNSTLRSHLPATKRDSLPKQGCLLQTIPTVPPCCFQSLSMDGARLKSPTWVLGVGVRGYGG